MSRNRNFDLFETESGARQAQRRHLRVQALARDLRRYAVEGTVRLLRGGDDDEGRPDEGGVVEVELPAVRFKRRVFVDAFELKVLGEDPGLAALLGLSSSPAAAED